MQNIVKNNFSRSKPAGLLPVLNQTIKCDTLLSTRAVPPTILWKSTSRPRPIRPDGSLKCFSLSKNLKFGFTVIFKLVIPADSNVILLAKIERGVKLSRRRFSSYIGTVKKFLGHSHFCLIFGNYLKLIEFSFRERWGTGLGKGPGFWVSGRFSGWEFPLTGWRPILIIERRTFFENHYGELKFLDDFVFISWLSFRSF